MKLTKDEKKFLAALNNKKTLTVSYAQLFWATPFYAKSKLKRLNSLGLIKVTENNTVILTKKDLTKYL